MSNKKFDFNKGITELEEIVSLMEEGDLSLDSALEYYENGISLIRKCQSALNSAEQKIAKLTKEDNYSSEQDFS